MWETFISWYINNYLGKYVDNLNSQQLSFALRQGELELENVPLKKNIFRSWGLPIEIKSGIVGRIKIEFNLLKYFRNEPVLITIEDIYLVAVTLNLSEWDPVHEAALVHETKMSALDSHEGRWKTQFDLASNSSSYYSSLYFSSMQIGASIVTKVVENLQLNVRNVHIRFEDTSQKCLVAFGFTLKSLTAQSCDSSWTPLSTSSAGNNSECSFKTLQLTEFAIYCDTKAEKFSDLNPVDLIASMSKPSRSHEYLLRPVSAEARISKNNSSHPISSSSKPRFDVTLSLDKVPLQISDTQFRKTFRSYKSYSRLYRNCRFRHYRPFPESVKECPLLWWKYAVRAILAHRGYKQRNVLKTYEEMLARARDNITFVETYEKHLRQEMLSVEHRKLRDRMEAELHYEEIVALREVAMRRVENQSKGILTPGSGNPLESGALRDTTRVDPSSPSDTTPAIPPTTSSYGAFSYIFPSWSNWVYSASSQTASAPEAIRSSVSSSEDFENEISQLRKSESELDESILDDMKSYGRDAVLARFKFVLKKGLVTLSRPTGEFMEMDFCGVNISTEFRPRSGAHKFNISLTSLSLRDCSTKSLLVSPHSTFPNKHGGLPKGLPKISHISTESIFKLNYERKPHRKAGHRISVTTKPLDLVIYPDLWQELSSFFTFSDVEDYLEISQNRYEIMKEKTKDELRSYWERLINTRTYSVCGELHSDWEITLDISAPQIVIYGSGRSATSKQNTRPKRFPRGPEPRDTRDVHNFIVFDLGRFKFTNDSEENDFRRVSTESEPMMTQSPDFDEDANEEFLTPCSSPAPERVTSEGDSESGSSRLSLPELHANVERERISSAGAGINFTESMDQLHAKLYKKYKLEITDIQIIVAEEKPINDESWKIANSRCTSLLHLVDRFSIDLQLERRIVYSEDPEWPTLTVVATLPKLNFHLNKSKISSFRTVLRAYASPQKQNSGHPGEIDNFSNTSLNGSQHNLTNSATDSAAGRSNTTDKESNNTVQTSNCKLFLAQFTIQSISVEIQSRGRSIAELQITGARTTLTKWTKHTSISFVIHSILLADAVQTFGPDFELLLASHKHVCMDSVSGSLLDSDPTSPMSPQSPSSPLPFNHPKIHGGHHLGNQLPIPSELHNALLSSLTSKGAKYATEHGGIQSPTFDADALISAELMLINSENEDLGILSVLFNNLDVIANQETFIEILQFLQEIFPSEEPIGKIRTQSGTGGTLLESTGKWKIEASFDFNRLNILLLREVIGKDGNRGGRKIATATACDARVGFCLGGNVLKVEGSLGGLQMLNLTPEGKYHQRILSVGKDPLIDVMHNVFNLMSKTSHPPHVGSTDSALDFRFEKSMDPESDNLPIFTMRMASVIYTHCPIFLIDLKKCIDQFQVPLATKLKSAAAQIALGLVRQDTLNGAGRSSPFASFSISLDKLSTEDGGDCNSGTPKSRNLGVKVDITLDSPVIALPRSRTSSEVLVANLGQITVTANGASPWDDGLKGMPTFQAETGEGRKEFTETFSLPNSDGITYSLLIRDVSLYSLDLQERWNMIDNLRMTYPTSNRNTLIRAQELYYCDHSTAKAILHNTVLQFVIEYIPEAPFVDAELNALTFQDEDEFSGPKLGIQGRVVNPLKVSVTPEQYAQVLDSLGNIAAGEDDFLQSELKVESLEVLKGRWKEEVCHAKAPAAIHLSSPTRMGEDSLSISATFEIPELVVELVVPEEVKLGKGEIPHLSLSCSDLSFECEKEGYVTDMKISLKSLSLEDTSVPKDSQYRLLAISKSSEGKNSTCAVSSTLMSSVFHRNPNISESCPNLIHSSPIHVPAGQFTPVIYFSPNSCARTETSSLPDHLDPDDIFSERFHQTSKSVSKLRLTRNRIRSERQKRQSLRDYESPSTPMGSNGPATPPPSPRPMDFGDNLVSIHITMVDRKSYYFLTKYRGVQKSTNIEFNTLDLVLTPSTFICLRRFFSEAFAHSDFDKESFQPEIQPRIKHQERAGDTGRRINVSSPVAGPKDELEKNTETEIHVKALRVKLGDVCGAVAEAEVTDVMCRFVNQGKDFNGVDGRMGSLQVRDISPYAGKYPVKFSFQGKQALNFDYCRKENETKFRLEMASVLYIHTHRFYTEFYALVTSIFGSSGMRGTETESLQSQTTESARVVLNIQAGAPVIFLPYSSTSPSLLVSDFGHLSVRNKFMEEGDAICVFDYISVDLLEMDLYSAELVEDPIHHPSHPSQDRKSWIFDKTQIISKTLSSSSLLKNKCALNLKIKRLLSRRQQTSPTLASMSIQGTLSAVYATLNLDKYKLIRGLLQYNIGEQFTPSVTRPSSPLHQQRRLSRDLSTVIARQASASTASARLDLAIELDLLNVTLEVLKANDEKISRVDFLRSKFTFQNYSDGTRDVDLASQEILISDIRLFPNSSQTSRNKKNVFTNILQQSSIQEAKTKPSAKDGQSSSTAQSKTKLRAEVHLRETQRSSNVTVLLNSMRLMLILDWWLEVQSFLSEHIPEPPLLQLQPEIFLNDNESLAEKRLRNISPLLNRSRDLNRPVTVSAGIVTKRAPVLDVPVKTFDFKLNVSECELVVVEDISAWDTNAVILKITATLTWRPHLERPISCNIIESEMFSCVLGIETETALSILDPTNISIEVIRKTIDEPAGILDATFSPSTMDKILKIKSAQISLRLSYYDMKMFLQLLERFSKDARVQLMNRPSSQHAISPAFGGFGEAKLLESNAGVEKPYVDPDSVQRLLSMGFPYESCGPALLQCDGRVEDAAILISSPTNELFISSRIFEPTQPIEDTSGHLKQFAQTSKTENRGAIHGIEVKCTNLSVCIIDDCKDADVPLAEINLAGLELHQNCADRSATVVATISTDYYNRELCGWEPLLEPWKCFLNLQQNERGQLGRQTPSSEFPSKAPELELSLTSRQVMNINCTSTFLSLYKTVSFNWSDEYGHLDKRRTPFVPFVLKNETGSTLWFSTIISNQEDVLKQNRDGKLYADGTSWIQVGNGGVQTFSFEGRGKLRHRNTHQLRMHQLIVRVNGWFDSRPVSVDRVGTYFRDVIPISNIPGKFGTVSRMPAGGHPKAPVETADLPTTRLVFEVSLQGSAQKLVQIRSALMVKNTLPQTMELKLENTIIYPAFEMVQTGGGSYCIYVPPNQIYPIPLHSVCSQIWIRPIVGTEFQQTIYSYCSKPLPVGRDSEGIRTCTSYTTNQAQPFRFCVAVKRDEFPADTDCAKSLCKSPMCNNVAIGLAKRANLITILSPLVIVNLLPFEVAFEVKGNGGDFLRDHISAGKKYCTTNIDTTDPVEITFTTENFPTGTPVTVSMNSSSFVGRLRLIDTNKRPLYLNARVSRGDGGTITVRIACQYWIVNKSGLPLMIKQEGVSADAAGQFQENEHARMVVPLMFSFADPEGASNVTMRVGTGLHTPPAKPQWSRSFPLQNGTRVRKLIVGLSHSQPEVVYLAGVEVTDGKGRYRDSKIVTITPRFVIENRSSRRMQISQRNYATSFNDLAAEATHLTLPSACTLPFHWPRLDKDQLLCIRLLDIKGGTWSGGFPIENVSSFHLNVRNFEGQCYFIRVETVVEGPTYFVVFSDTADLPPPFRLDNFSLVPIIIHQTNVGDERLKLAVKAESSVPYAWDEPTLPSNLTLAAPGGTSVIARMDDSSLGLVAHITYENFFYIALSATFPRNDGGGLGVAGMETLQLVLDVPEGCKVVLRKKDTGNRNQLWRVNADGMIEHEGSSPPRDPRKPISAPSLVLDIAGQATQPTQCVSLMLRKPDSRRFCTQHWEFTRDGRLKCSNLLNVYVQAKDGFGPLHGNNAKSSSAHGEVVPVAAWQMWNEAVLGPDQPVCYVRTDSGIPAEQAVSKQKLRAGSGRISVYVDTDGPTRVLRIIDTEKPPLSFLNHTYEENSINTIPRVVLSFNLEGGLGLSIINCNPREELLYIFLSRLAVHWVDTKESESVSICVDNLQIDNQLHESEKGVAIYVKQVTEPEDEIPALCLRWKRLKTQLNAYLFKELELRIKPLNMIFEEKLLLKMCSWMGIGTPTEIAENIDGGIEVQKALTNSTSLTTNRFYFGQLRIHLKSVRLSLLTSSRLSPELSQIKRRLGLTLIRFEETLVEFTDCIKQHPFETFDFLLASILKHYSSELTSQALFLLGSVDFLGNPVGFVTDVSVGVSSLITEGSVDALLRNVTHGISNSAAKVTGSLGDGLTRTLTLDSKHEEWRRTVWDGRSSSSSAITPLNAGIKGFSIGIVGGLTSIFNQTYDGVVNDGFTGLVSGLGKGIVGTVTKPVVGVLDLAAGVATTVRDSSRSSSRMLPNRIRKIRLATGNGGLLPPYSEASAQGQKLMHEMNGYGHRDAVFIGCEAINSGHQTFRFLISSEQVTVFPQPKPHIPILLIPLSELLECRLLEITTERSANQSMLPTATYSFETKLVIEFARAYDKPQVTVDNEQVSVAKTIVQQVNYARILYEEMRHSQINQAVTTEE